MTTLLASECLYERVDQKHPEGPGHSIIKAIGELNPSLGQYVRSLSLERLENRWIDEGAKDWVYNERAGNLFARVLRSVVNVQNINLGFLTEIGVWRDSIPEDYNRVEVFDDAVRGCLDGPSQWFEQLTTLSIDADAIMQIRDISSVFMLPAIKFLSLWNFTEEAPITDWAIEKSCSTIGILQLNCSALQNMVVAQIVESLNSLESFDYTYDTEHVSAGYELCWAEILMALSQHRLSLQSLGLGELTYEAKRGGLLGCMKDFLNLEQLRVELGMLIDLTIGDIDIGRTLTPDIKSLSLDFKAESRFASLYGPAIASLGGSVFKQDKKFLHIHSDTSHMCLGNLQLSKHIKTLLYAGLTTSLSEMEG
ncbi:hypothetical protein FB567DRAFT_245129 [Paraphoma chrysanthemicola]|uniref:Uncharacterized protein n=1 Tax=Paraphoma chrysanthemicola TaxID=798071 RepID=A0A8K0QU33_9PLEO|nr:hypothetical protein FB567DRAFT_245129 [Paraphoma chrysanthemicola]